MFLLQYSGNQDPTNITLVNLGPIGLTYILSSEASAEQIDKVFKNLIVIIDHFFSSGLVKPKRQSKDDGEDKVTHYW